jgi:hypothetical protein
MRRLLTLIIVGFLLCAIAGCDAVFIGTDFRSGAVTVSGSVVQIVLTNVVGTDGTLVQVTIVTFFQNSTSNSVTFCGNTVSQFPMNNLVTARFTPAQPCATLILVILG